jgi:hypothetical protein
MHIKLHLRVDLIMLLVSTWWAACASAPLKPVATPADFERLGTRHYPDRGHDEVATAAVTALKLLGYEVVTTDPRIRTAPRDVATTTAATYGEYAGRANSFTEAVAWDIDVTPEGSGTMLRATPRATVNGEPMPQVYQDWAERNFGQLMKEIDGNLPAKK